jgi:hypothetical protein
MDPREGGAWMFPFHDDIDDTIILMVELTPFDAS